LKAALFVSQGGGVMDEREAKREACAILVQEIQNYIDSGAIFIENSVADGGRMATAFLELQDEMMRRSGQKTE
jgi:hypothetical protein